MKKTLLMIYLFLIAGNLWAQTYLDNGVSFELNGSAPNKTLTISYVTPGSGMMPDYTYVSAKPWHSDATNISTVIIMPGVTSIGDFSLSGLSNLTSITIPETVTTIGASSVRGCTILTSVAIPEGVTLIKNNAFRACSALTDVTFPSSLKTIEYEAFNACNMTAINLPEGLEYIDNRAFYSAGTSFTSNSYVIIPKSVTYIGESAFQGTTGLLKYIIFSDGPSSTTIGNNAFNGPGAQRIYVPADKESDFENIWTQYEDNIDPYYTLTYDAQDGAPAITIMYYNSAGTILFPQSNPANPTLDGCILEDWYSSNTTYSVANKWITSNKPSSTNGNILVYAHWQCDVTFDSQGGSSVANRLIDYKTAITEPTSDEPSLRGYTFDGWHTTPDCTTLWDFSKIIERATTLYAKWTVNNYTLSFDGNGGNDKMNSISVTYDKPVGQLPEPTRAGCLFDGWYYNNDLYTNTTIFKEINDITLTAKWNIITKINTQPQSAVVCEGFTDHTLYVRAIGENLSYQWYRENKPIQEAIESSYIVNNINAGFSADFHVKVTGSFGSEESYVANVRAVMPMPAVLEFETTPAGTLTTKQDYTFCAQYYSDIATYLWSSSSESVIFSSTIGKSITARFTKTGADTIKLTYVHGCTTGSGYKTIEFPVMIEAYTANELTGDESLSAYPNPTNGIVTITGAASGEEIAIYNIAGTKITSFTANDAKTTINISNLANGIYFIRTNTETFKIIKNN